MEFINKQSSKAIQQIDNLLQRLNVQGRLYQADLYSKFRHNPRIKKAVRTELLTEQSNRCCYCMRKIDDSNTTIEHLMPRSVVSLVEYNSYINSGAPLDSNNVCLENEFINNQNKTYPPYPHTVAYQNLTASCNGQIENGAVMCCNNKRGNKFIEPIVFDVDIHNKIIYKKNGWALFPTDTSTDIEGTLGILGLNNKNLRAIRVILIHITDNSINLNDSSIDKDQIISSVKQKVDPELQTHLNNFKKDVYWNLLKDYDYFLQNPNIQP